jgi:hypothetical protein
MSLTDSRSRNANDVMRVGTIRLSRLASGYTLGNLSAAHPMVETNLPRISAPECQFFASAPGVFLVGSGV